MAIAKHNRERLTATQHNYLMEAKYDLGIDETRLLWSAFATIDPRSESIPDILKVTVVDWAKTWGIHGSGSAYEQLERAANGLLCQTVTLPQRANGEIWKIQFIKSAGYAKKNGYVKIVLNDELKQYLHSFDKGNFTSPKLRQFRDLSSVHSFRILGMVINMDRYEDGCGFWSVSVSKLRRLLNMETKYTRWRDFDRYVLRKAVKQINERTNYKVEIELVKKRRKVVSVNFLFTPNEQPDMFKQG